MEEKLVRDVDFFVRDVGNEDLKFIYSSWLKSYRDSMAVRFIGNDVYYKRNTLTIDKILLRENTKALVAHAEDDPTHILGYIVFTENVLHWIYVKHSYRKLGIGTSLMKEFLEGSGDGRWMSYLPEDEAVFYWLKRKFDLDYDPERKYK